MSARTAALAGFLLALFLATLGNACQPRVLREPTAVTTARLFTACLHAARPERRACQASYVAYAGTVRK